MKLSRALVASASAAALVLTSLAALAERAPSEFPAIGQPAVITLLDAGKGKKAPLRWKAKAGVTEKLKMVMDTKMQIVMAGETMPMDMKMHMDMDGKVREVGDDGSALIEMVVTDAGMEMPGLEGPEAANMVRDMMRGLTIEARMDARGATSGTKVSGGGDMMAQLGEQMNNSLDQLAVPFPEEPVGVGARWQALTSLEMNGMKMRMVATYELTRLEGDKGAVTVTVEQHADAQVMDMGGAKAELTRLSSTGGGTTEFDLTRPMFAKAAVSLKMDAAMSVMGQSATMKMDARIAMTPGR